MHGWGITQRIQQLSKEVFQVGQGSLYPALHRLEEAGWIKARWGTTETGRRARVYDITARGRKQLAAEELRWKAITSAVGKILKHA
jgi:transcriptional regulator